MYNSQTPSKRDLPSSQQLKRSTILALCGATVLMITTVLPAEYGKDPTGLGEFLGLTSMGKIKQSLAQEAALQKLAEKTPAVKQETAAVTPTIVEQNKTTTATSATTPVSAQKHEMQITLAPDEGAEVKMEMKKGAEASFEWTSEGGLVNFDVHGEPFNAPPNSSHGYKKGRQVKGDQGVLEAAFDGKHGWFWRNRGKQPITIKLLTKGDYLTIKRMS